METTVSSGSQSVLANNFGEIQFALIFGGMILLFLVEEIIPRRKAGENQSGRWLSNIGLTVFNYFFLIFYSIALTSIMRHLEPDSPLIQHFKLNDIPAFIVLFITMEFILYWLHRLFHRVEPLWRIHAVHHSDTEFDVTTSHRHHPLEPMLNALIITPIVFALGAPILVAVIYNLLHTALTLFHHSNIRLPQTLDKLLRPVIITPDYHRIHHLSDKQFTDSNYGSTLPWFDYLFGTARKKPYAELAEQEIGLEVLRKPEENRLDILFATPFIYKNKRIDAGFKR